MKKKKKDKDAGNTSVADVNAAVPSDPSCSTRDVDLSLYKCYFRELDMEVFVALSKDLKLDKKDVKVKH
jgi:hypothetical protein